MLSRVCAVWLVALILLPFSAPFSTCDVQTLFPGASRDTTAPTPHSPLPVVSLDDGATRHALILPRATGRVRLAASAFLRLHVNAAVTAGRRTGRDRVASGSGRSSFASPLRI